MALSERIAAAKAELAKIQPTEDEIKERDERAELAQVQAEIKKEKRAKLRNVLDRRLEAYQIEHPNDAVEGLTVDGFDDVFVIRRNGKAHAAFSEGLRRASQATLLGKQPPPGSDFATNARKYAMQVIVDWNGETNFDKDSDLSNKLIMYLSENPGLVASITDCAGRLAGVYAEERSKSSE